MGRSGAFTRTSERAETALTPPPRAWIAERVKYLNALLANRTEKSALALRRLTGPVTLTPEEPEESDRSR